MTLSIIQTIHRGVYGMSDEQLANERDAQRSLREAIEAMSAAIAKINWQSSVEHVDSTAWANFIHDELPLEKTWDEKISNARRR